MHEPYITRTPDDVYHKLANAKYITVIDFKKSFWQFLLDEESSYLTTFNTHLDVIATLGYPLVPMYQETAISKALTPSMANWTMSLE